MEGFEDRESIIGRLIENLAEKENINIEDIFSDIITFAEISKEDENAEAYLEEVAEMIGISFQEMSEYANKKAEDNKNAT